MKYSLIIIFFCFAILSSCNKTSNYTDSDNVYLAGEVVDEGKSVATYWKNGKAVYLSDSASLATSIAVSGGDVFVAGYILTGTGNYIRYWKNGSPVMLTDGSDSGIHLGPNGYFPNSIAVSGKDVYVAGYARQGTGLIAKYWKNGKAITLSDSPSIATSIAVSGNDVYVLGYDNGVGVYWKNGSPVPIPSPAGVNAIAVSGNDVYLGANTNGPMYWKNANPVNLTDSFQYAYTSCIAVSGNVVCAAGYADNSSVDIYSIYWKNGNPVTLGKKSQAFSVAVSGNDVYVAGYAADSANERYAMYWKNGIPVKLTKDGEAFSIFITKK